MCRRSQCKATDQARENQRLFFCVFRCVPRPLRLSGLSLLLTLSAQGCCPDWQKKAKICFTLFFFTRHQRTSSIQFTLISPTLLRLCSLVWLEIERRFNLFSTCTILKLLNNSFLKKLYI